MTTNNDLTWGQAERLGKTWSKGLGSVEAAQRFYWELRMTAAQIGLETASFDEKQWRQDRPDEGRQQV